ncbi:MAG: TraB/GumN family protein [Bacteroidota bacterium]
MKKEILTLFKKGLIKALVFAASFTLGMFIARQAKAQNEASSLLWKVEGKKLDKPSYVFGTIHLICPDDFFLPESVKNTVSSVDQVVMELDMDDPQLMPKMQQLSMNPGMKNFSADLTEGQANAINGFFTKHYGANLTQLGIMKPFALMSMMLVKSIGCDQPASYEQSLVKEAKTNEIEVLGLETVEFQFSVFDNASLEEQVSWLVDYAEDEEAMKNEFEMLVQSYKKQDVDAMHDLMISSPQFQSLMDELLYKRNQNWISKIEEYASEKPTFFAVGAGHLGSDKGVLALLRKEGYKVTPVLQ